MTAQIAVPFDSAAVSETRVLLDRGHTWQLVINTGTTIVTFLMVFLIQNPQNRDNAAMQVKLDELVRVSEVRNLFVGIEHLTEDEIDSARDAKLAQRQTATVSCVA
jgi:low affinity Fe/Cu permease